MKLSVIVPVYNEIGTLAEIIRRIRAAAGPGADGIDFRR